MKKITMKAVNCKVAGALVVAVVLGYGIRSCRSSAPAPREEPPAQTHAMDQAGNGAAMVGMGNMSGAMEGKLTLSPEAEALADIRTVPVERKFVDARIRMVGKIDYDETRLRYITAWVAGRIDRLYIDYTGIEVKEGDHMVYLYSPELLAAQEELIAAASTAKQLDRSDSSLIRGRAGNTVKSAREKLRLLGLSAEQIEEIESRGTPSDHMTIYAPMGGVVVHKNAQEGMYIQTGTRIYTIADLTHLWVQLDAYESDLPWIRYGQEVKFETEAYPGEAFKGRISFIDPVLSAQTRTVRVRVNVENSRGELKPEMFVRATVRSRIAVGGKVMDPSLAGKWIGRMHPAIVRDEPGTCPVCGEKLVKAESLGYISLDEMNTGAPLVIPASAPLVTGMRAVVYVKVPDKPGAYEGRVIELGPRAGDYYLVKSGLKEGELVVTKGNFKIDSAIQIQAKPSMMNPEGGGPSMGGMAGMDMGGKNKKK